MEEQKALPIVRLELSSGVFRIPTHEAVYEISVMPRGGVTDIVETIVAREAPAPTRAHAAPPPPATEAQPDATFYKKVTEEMLSEIGHLARKLSLSIQEIPKLDEVQPQHLEKAGIDLESAKGLLSDVVKMTEKATMQIMDISENIQDDCRTIQKNLANVQSLKMTGTLQEGRPASSGSAPADMLPALRQQRQRLCDLAEAGSDAPAPEPAESPVETPPRTETLYRFDLDVLFQTLYELCTNEAVKKHIKAMRAVHEDAFDTAAIRKQLSVMAANVEREETFFNFPLGDLLKVLFKYTDNEQNRQILKKMNQTADSIFLDQVLPVEGSVEEREVVPETPPPGDVPGPPAVGGMLQDAIAVLDQAIEAIAAAAEAAGAGDQPEQVAAVGTKDHEILIAALESSESTIENIILSIQKILEALTFQDLSGQRIVKIADMLTSVQVQLLSILVSFGVKLKTVQAHKDIAPADTDEIVHQEVGRMMSRIADEWGDEETQAGPLNQNEVDRLLGELGF
jgi:chemotaxis regulatin CheY-phosphate phosphatase CheZ